jgi:hypothetical protein
MLRMADLGAAAEARLEVFLDGIGKVLGRKERRASFAAYFIGLLSEAERKSVEPLAARMYGEPERWARHVTPTRRARRARSEGPDALVLDTGEDPAWFQRARGVMQTLRAEHQFLADAPSPLVEEKEEITWWNFAGGAANLLLATSGIRAGREGHEPRHHHHVQGRRGAELGGGASVPQPDRQPGPSLARRCDATHGPRRRKRANVSGRKVRAENRASAAPSEVIARTWKIWRPGARSIGSGACIS